MRLLCLLVLLSISFTGVGQKIPVSKKHHAKDIHQVNLYKAYQKQGNLQLSTVAKSMQYIPLETRGGCLIGEYLKRIFITSTDIFILDFGQGAYRFTKEGKFVNKIGRIGKGPGECQKPIDMLLDTVRQHIMLLDHDKIVAYNYKGEFIDHYRLKMNSNDVLSISEKILLANNMYYQYAKPGERYSMIFFSTDQKKEISKVACEKNDKIPFSICRPVMYNYNKHTFVKDYWGDTIYQVIDPFNLKAYAEINTGKLKHRDSDDNSIVTGEKNPRDTWIVDITYISETDRFIFFTSNKGLFIYDKKNKETHCCSFRKENDQWYLFNNDLSPGPDLMSFIYVHPVSNNCFATFNYAHDFFDEDGNLRSGLDKSLKKLKPDDNPVLVLVEFKN